MKMVSRFIFLILHLSVLVTLTVSMSACSQPKETGTEQESSSTEVQKEAGIVSLTTEGIQKNNIELLTVSDKVVQKQFKTLGEVKANENRLFHVSSLISGRIAEENVDLGDRVRQGQILATVQNPEVVKIQAASIHELHSNQVSVAQAQSKLRLAQRTLDREKKLVTDGLAPRKDLFQAESDTEVARAELAGLQEHNVHIRSEGRALLREYGLRFNPQSERLQSRSPIVSPRAGVITKKDVTPGDIVSPSQMLYEVADLSQVWLDLTIYPQDLKDIKVGQIVRFVSDSLPKKTFLGRVNYLPPISNKDNHTFTARAYLTNEGIQLKPGMFGQAVIERSQPRKMPFVPEVAVQKYAKETFVFIPDGKGRYKKQNIVIGEQTDQGYFVDSGLEAGAVVVGTGSFILKSEMLKSQFGEE